MPHPLRAALNLGRLGARRAGTWRRALWRRAKSRAKQAGEAAKAARALGEHAIRTGRRAVSAARWSAMRRRGDEARALCKVSLNCRERRDRFALSTLENHLVRQAAGMQRTLWIPPRRVQQSVRQILPPNAVTFADLSSLVRPVASEPTIRFADEVVRERRPYHDTTMFGDVARGKTKRRRLGGEMAVLTPANFAQYYEKCLRQADEIARHGLQPWDKSAALSYDGDIAVLLSEDGELIFLRRGTHRLGIAYALDLDRIPVQIFMVAGPRLARVAEAGGIRGWHLPWRLAATVRRACDQAAPRD